MDYQALTEQLVDLLTMHGVIVRKDAMGGGGGGLCRINNKNIFYYDTDASSFEAAVTCARAVYRAIEDLESIYLRPFVRDFIDKYGTKE